MTIILFFKKRLFSFSFPTDFALHLCISSPQPSALCITGAPLCRVNVLSKSITYFWMLIVIYSKLFWLGVIPFIFSVMWLYSFYFFPKRKKKKKKENQLMSWAFYRRRGGRGVGKKEAGPMCSPDNTMNLQTSAVDWICQWQTNYSLVSKIKVSPGGDPHLAWGKILWGIC